MNILYIDTSKREEIFVELGINGKKYQKIRKGAKSEEILLMIDEILKEHKISLKNLNEVKVNTGPGSFTGLRVGTSIANALSFFLKIPVNGKKVGKQAEPIYN